jgi:hypothetical protein
VNLHHFHKGFGKKTYYNLYAKEQVQANPPESVPEAITSIEIISWKPMMKTDRGSIIPAHTVSIFKEC